MKKITKKLLLLIAVFGMMYSISLSVSASEVLYYNQPWDAQMSVYPGGERNGAWIHAWQKVEGIGWSNGYTEVIVDGQRGFVPDYELSYNKKVLTEEEKLKFHDLAVSLMKYKLKSPSTAIWNDYTEDWYLINDKGYIVVMGNCEAMNGFGGYGQVKYLFEFHETGKVMYQFAY